MCHALMTVHFVTLADDWAPILKHQSCKAELCRVFPELRLLFSYTLVCESNYDKDSSRSFTSETESIVTPNWLAFQPYVQMYSKHWIRLLTTP